MKIAFVIVSVLTCSIAAAQPAAPPKVIVKAARMFDGKADKPRTDVAVLVEGDRIKDIGTPAQITAKAPGVRVIDVGNATLMPGLVDAHTHLLADDTTEDYATTLIKQSIAARAIAGTAHARAMLGYGFTTLRDVESEGAMFADADLARAIDAGLVVGPRLHVSTRGLARTGGYLPNDVAWDAHVGTGAQLVDGVDEIRKAVREQVRFGAAWIKVYADFDFYPGANPARPLRSRPNFRDDELKALVDEAHRIGVKVAAHATGWDGIDAALRAGVDSIEHGFGITDDLAKRMANQKVAFVPTITAVKIRVGQSKDPRATRLLELHKAAVRQAAAANVRIVNGSDIGSYPYKTNAVVEVANLVEYGLTRVQALRAATSSAGILLAPFCAPDQRGCPGDDTIGVIAPNALADLIAVDGNPLDDIATLSRLKLVMKGGVVFTGP
jgi:imidazolonepropionase-like amidohydrolase